MRVEEGGWRSHGNERMQRWAVRIPAGGPGAHAIGPVGLAELRRHICFITHSIQDPIPPPRAHDAAQACAGAEAVSPLPAFERGERWSG